MPACNTVAPTGNSHAYDIVKDRPWTVRLAITFKNLLHMSHNLEKRH